MHTFSPLQAKKHTLFLCLTGFFIANAVVAEIIGAKIFSVEATLGLPSGGWLMPWGDRWAFNQAAGAVNWPFVFIISDILNEYFGKEGVRKVSYLTAVLIAYALVVIYLATLLEPASFWLDVNRGTTNFDINFAFNKIFRQGMGIMIGSISAFLVAQLLDATVFQWIKNKTKGGKIWLRAAGSTVVSQLVDSFVVVFVAFYFFGNWSANQSLSVALNNYLYKFIVAILMTPVLYAVHYAIERYLGIHKNPGDSVEVFGVN